MGSEKRGEIKVHKISGLRVFACFVILLILTAIGGGLYLSGSPGKERARQFDNRRLNDLQQISVAVDSFYEKTSRLPDNLDVLSAAGGQFGYLPTKITDPMPDRGYEYIVMNEADYQLCAIFDLPSESLDAQGKNPPVPARESIPVTSPTLVTEKGVFGRVRTWEHPAGYFCFALNATDQIGSVLCGLQNPCQTGQTCAELPKNKGTRCVPAGFECDAAGCPGKCTLSESYPVQVTCAPLAEKPSEQPALKTTGCKLMKESNNGGIDCFGCANGVCKSAPSGDWQEYTAPQEPGYMGISYACFESAQGCALVQ
jgi:hypothetical protein